MSPKRRQVSGQQVVETLIKYFGFEKARQKGSHIVLRRITSAGKVVTVVPNHKEIKAGTLRSVLKLAHINPEDFWSKI